MYKNKEVRKMSDYLVKSLVYDGAIRAYAVDATETVGEAQKLHDTWSAASAAFGRSLIGTLLLSASELSSCRHNHYMCINAFFRKNISLLYAKPVLFVCNYKPKLFKLHIFLYYGMSTDYDICFPC